MCRNTVAFAVVTAALAFAGSAAATDVTTKDKTPIESAPPPSYSGTSGNISGQGPGTTRDEGELADGQRWGGLLDYKLLGKNDPKPWEVGAVWETHALIRQDDLEGQAANKVLNYAYFYARADISARNRISIRGGFYERFLADDGETGLRLSDISITYTRIVPLGHGYLLKLAGSLSAPTSFSSQKMSLITAPGLSVNASKRLGNFSIDARVFGQYYITEYTSAAGGAPNPRFALGAYLEGEYAMWFLPSLSLGADLFTEYLWLYDVSNGAGDPNIQFTGTVADTTYQSQPVQQSYGGEVFVRYTPPSVYRIKSDISLAYAQGDPTMGYTSILHDGISHIYPFWRLSSEVYVAITARY